MRNGLPDHLWDNRELLLEVLEDRDQDWQRLREDAYECVRFDSGVALQPTEEVEDFLRQRDRKVIEKVARRLLGFGERRAVLKVLEQRLHDIIHLGRWMDRTEQEDIASANVVFQRSCDTARWLLNTKLKELEQLGISAVDLSAQITEMEVNVENKKACTQVRVAEGLIAQCLPLTRNELSGEAACSAAQAFPT